MFKILAILGAAAAGAAAMYILDPDRGGRRRALIRDRAVGLSNDAKDAIDKKSAHLRNKAQGLIHEAKSMLPSGNAEPSLGTEEKVFE